MKTTLKLAKARKEIETISKILKRAEELRSDNISLKEMRKGTIIRDSEGNVVLHKF